MKGHLAGHYRSQIFRPKQNVLTLPCLQFVASEEEFDNSLWLLTRQNCTAVYYFPEAIKTAAVYRPITTPIFFS